jgi:hypothetical protein
MDRNGHILLLHHSEGERMRWVADWFAAGLVNGEKLIYADVAGWGVDWLVRELTHRGLDADHALEDKRLEFIALEDVLDISAEDGIVRRALDDDAVSGVRLSIRCDAVCDVNLQRGLTLEREIKGMTHERRLSVLCQYDARTTRSAGLALALELHPDWVFEAQIKVRRRGHVIEVAGILDSLDGEVLSLALQRMTVDLGTHSVLALDLREVDALTVGACHALIEGTSAFRERGGEVRCGVAVGRSGELLRSLVTDRDRGFEVV